MLAPSVPESAGPGRRRAEGSAHPGLPGKGGEEGVLIRFSAAGSVICQTAHLPGSAPDDLKLARGETLLCEEGMVSFAAAAPQESQVFRLSVLVIGASHGNFCFWCGHREDVLLLTL